MMITTVLGLLLLSAINGGIFTMFNSGEVCIPRFSTARTSLSAASAAVSSSFP